jgi:glycosyltransferase involved in cell wall biosynthesis
MSSKDNMTLSFPNALVEKNDWPWTDSSSYPNTNKKEKDWPKISIITPSYQQGQYIEETILSVIRQGYPNLEYIIIDGGSTDNTVEIIQKYNSWIHYWVSEPDGGQSNALNKGMSLASGEILAYINSDDIYLPGAFFKVAEAFKELDHKKIVISGKLKFFPKEGEQIPLSTWDIKDWIQRENYSLPQPSTFWSRPSIEITFQEKYNYVFDRAFFIDLMRNHYLLKIIPETLAAFRFHEESKTVSSHAQFVRENKQLNLETAKTLSNLQYLKVKNRYKFKEMKTAFLKSNSFSLEAIQKMILIPIYNRKSLIQRWYWGRIKILLKNLF